MCLFYDLHYADLYYISFLDHIWHMHVISQNLLIAFSLIFASIFLYHIRYGTLPLLISSITLQLITNKQLLLATAYLLLFLLLFFTATKQAAI